MNNNVREYYTIFNYSLINDFIIQDPSPDSLREPIHRSFFLAGCQSQLILLYYNLYFLPPVAYLYDNSDKKNQWTLDILGTLGG